MDVGTRDPALRCMKYKTFDSIFILFQEKSHILSNVYVNYAAQQCFNEVASGLLTMQRILNR